MTRYADIVVSGFSSNTIFDIDHSRNRDNCLYPFWLLREAFKAKGVELNTKDLNKSRSIAFELHMDAQRVASRAPAFVVLSETPQVWPDNASQSLLSRYRKFFTWNDHLVDGDRFIKYYCPSVPSTFQTLGWVGRDKLCCLIGGNKSLKIVDPRDLYVRRVEAIRWFERYAPQDFDLFGIGWGRAAERPGVWGKMPSRVSTLFHKLIGRPPFPSYRGPAVNKHETLLKYRFAICYENVADFPGYITEKIFDCFFAGCVPVYWGASNVEEYIPAQCLVDRRKYPSEENLHQYLISMSEQDYLSRQHAILDFLASSIAKSFSPDTFASIICDSVLADLKE